MAHDHSTESLTGNRMARAICVTVMFVVIEAVAGFLSHSLALLSDAGHNFADALSLTLSAWAIWIGQKPATAQRTYGFHRAGILTALVNAFSLVVVALLIFWEAFQRLRTPEPVHSGLMIGVAVLAILMNTVIALWLRGEASHDLNVRSAYLHMAGDAASAAGVVVAGIVVSLTGSTLADPIASIMIAGFILWSSWGILKETVSVLMEATPQGIDLGEVERAIRGGTRRPGRSRLPCLDSWNAADLQLVSHRSVRAIRPRRSADSKGRQRHARTRLRHFTLHDSG